MLDLSNYNIYVWEDSKLKFTIIYYIVSANQLFSIKELLFLGILVIIVVQLDHQSLIALVVVKAQVQ